MAETSVQKRRNEVDIGNICLLTKHTKTVRATDVSTSGHFSHFESCCKAVKRPASSETQEQRWQSAQKLAKAIGITFEAERVSSLHTIQRGPPLLSSHSPLPAPPVVIRRTHQKLASMCTIRKDEQSTCAFDLCNAEIVSTSQNPKSLHQVSTSPS